MAIDLDRSGAARARPGHVHLYAACNHSDLQQITNYGNNNRRPSVVLLFVFFFRSSVTPASRTTVSSRPFKDGSGPFICDPGYVDVSPEKKTRGLTLSPLLLFYITLLWSSFYRRTLSRTQEFTRDTSCSPSTSLVTARHHQSVTHARSQYTGSRGPSAQQDRRLTCRSVSVSGGSLITSEAV
jgi:hypothetical protein